MEDWIYWTNLQSFNSWPKHKGKNTRSNNTIKNIGSNKPWKSNKRMLRKNNFTFKNNGDNPNQNIHPFIQIHKENIIPPLNRLTRWNRPFAPIRMGSIDPIPFHLCGMDMACHKISMEDHGDVIYKYFGDIIGTWGTRESIWEHEKREKKSWWWLVVHNNASPSR